MRIRLINGQQHRASPFSFSFALSSCWTKIQSADDLIRYGADVTYIKCHDVNTFLVCDILYVFELDLKFEKKLSSVENKY